MVNVDFFRVDGTVAGVRKRAHVEILPCEVRFGHYKNGDFREGVEKFHPIASAVSVTDCVYHLRARGSNAIFKVEFHDLGTASAFQSACECAGCVVEVSKRDVPCQSSSPRRCDIDAKPALARHPLRTTSSVVNAFAGKTRASSSTRVSTAHSLQDPRAVNRAASASNRRKGRRQ